jgi:hypothetical protein
MTRITCGGCTTTWTGLTYAHCSVCHETFGGIRNFDRHRTDGACRHPTDVGLTIGIRGVWAEPFSWQREPDNPLIKPLEKLIAAFRHASQRGTTHDNNTSEPRTDNNTFTQRGLEVGDTTPTDTHQRGCHTPDVDYLNALYHDTNTDDGWNGPQQL